MSSVSKSTFTSQNTSRDSGKQRFKRTIQRNMSTDDPQISQKHSTPVRLRLQQQDNDQHSPRGFDENDNPSNYSDAESSFSSVSERMSDINNASIFRAITNLGDNLNTQLQQMTSTIKEQAAQIDSLNEKVKNLEESTSKSMKLLVEKSRKKVHVPLAVQRKIKQLYKLYSEEEQWDLDECWNIEVNMMITDQIADDVSEKLSNKYDRDVILVGLKNYFTSIKRSHQEEINDPEKFATCKQKKKYRARKQRMYNQRTKYVKEEEVELWAKVGVHDMSAEEDGEGAFVKKTPQDRPANVAALIRKLDERYNTKLESDNRNILKVKRVVSDSPRKEF